MVKKINDNAYVADLFKFHSADDPLYPDTVNSRSSSSSGATGGAMNAGNLLKSRLGCGELRCIGATFQKVYCVQPSVQDTISILRGLLEQYELHHGVKISAAVFAERYVTEHFLPEKAIAAKLKMEINSKPMSSSVDTCQDRMRAAEN
nr:Chaperonin ClpB [Ipomoea trifida]